MRTRTAVVAGIALLAVGLGVGWLIAPAVVRLVAALLICLLLPGWGWARRLRLRDGGDTLALSVVLSICATAVVGTAMAVAGRWSPAAGLLILIVVGVAGFVPAHTVAARLGELALHRPRPRRALDPALVAAAEDAAEEWVDWYSDARRRADEERAQQLAAAEVAEREWRDWYAATHGPKQPANWS